MTSKCVSTSGTWSNVSMAWSGSNQLFEEAFIRDFDSPSPDANLRAIRNIRNFITANPINKRIVVQNDLIRGRIMSLTTAFSTTADCSTTFKRDFLCMYASFLHESSTFTEDICKQERFLNDLLNAVNLECEGTSPPLREAIMLFLKTLFEADNLDQDVESLPIFKKTTALEIFTSNRLNELICLSEALSGALRRGDKGTRVGAEANTLVCLTKLLALLASHAELAERGGMALLRMAHRNVMVTSCPRHAPLVSQDRGLILTFDLANSAPCPDATAHAVARFSLKILFFAIYHLPSHFAMFKNVICETDPRSLISIYTHLSQPYSRCYLGCRNRPPTSRRRETNSDPVIYRSIGRSFEGAGDEHDECENEEELELETEVDSLSFRSPDGAFGLSGTADRVMCLLVGLLRGVLFWRCCCPSSATETPNAPTVVVARDRFGNDTVRADGLGLSDDEIALKILQPLTQNSLPLNGTGVNTWACHVMVLVLKQRPSLHSHLLYSQLLTPEFDDTGSCLLKALQPTRNYEEYGDFLEQLIPFSRLFACLASTCEDVRFRVGELSMIRALIQMFVTHPSLTTSPSIASLNLTLAVCQLLHGLSRSMALLHTLFSDASIADCLIELCDRLLPTLPSNPIHEEIVLAASSTLVNLQLCQLPELNTLRVKCIDIFHSLVRVGDGSQQAETKLSLRLNGVWGLANAAAIAASNCLANRMETIERLHAVTIIPEVISLCGVLLSTLSPSHNCDSLQADENKETKLLFETSGPVLNSKPSCTHLKSYLLQRGLLLLRNMLALKEVQIAEYSENIFSLLARVLSCNTAACVKYEGLVVLANLLTNSDARSQFWYQSELIQSLATTITTDAEVSILCGAILVVVNILEAPTPVATSVGGDSPGELFTHILSLLLFDDSRSYHGSHKGPSSSSSSWCQRSSLRSSRRRSVATNTAITPSSSPSRKSPESSGGIVELSPSPTMEAEPHDKPLLHLLGSFIDLFSVYSDSGASVSNVLAAGASTKKQVFREVWDWQCQCGRGGDVEDEQPRRRRGKRFTNITVSTIASLQYHNSGLLHRQESKFTLAKGITDAAGAAGGLKSLLASLLKGAEEEDASASPPGRTETAAGGAISEEGELEEKLE